MKCHLQLVTLAATTITSGLALILSGCDAPSTDGSSEIPPVGKKASGPLAIFTTFYPTQYFAQRIGGDLVKATCPVPEDADPIFWMPDSTAIAQYQSADLIVLNGANFAKWVDKVNLPESRILNTARPLESNFIKFKDAVEHSHGKEGSHSHEGIDGHTWVDPQNAKVQAAEIRNALILRLLDAHATIEANYQALAADLDALDKQFKEIAAAGMPPLLASHPAYNYIARRYDWNIESLDIDPAEAPNAEAMAAIADKLKAHPAKWLLWESQPITEAAQMLESEFGVKSIVFSPCELLSAAERAKGADYLSVMKANVAELRRVIE
ncbi:MAG: zinc ABC transporter substrate-binding protein [Verrucomicrobia bacterium]|nr:zinc ABC transporter substrate-binding protein [Verrucomicrobiota bacterium]